MRGFGVWIRWRRCWRSEGAGVRCASDADLINEVLARLCVPCDGIPERNRTNADVEYVLWYRDPDVLAGTSAAALPRFVRGARGADRYPDTGCHRGQPAPACTRPCASVGAGIVTN